jgi:MoxR-like ATPase
MAQPVLRHRVILKAESEIEGITVDDVLQSILDSVEVPR